MALLRKLSSIYVCFASFLLVFPFSHSPALAQTTPPMLPGFVDMHTHPRNDLAFGNELFYGVPYGNIDQALGNCNGYHGGYGLFDNPHGNVFRNKLVQEGESQYCKTEDHEKFGYPNFISWPAYCSIFHQQMWIDWIERAHMGGLNIMVALATHSHCMADAAETSGPYDDKTVMDNSIKGIKDLVANSSFMEVALTPQDVRRIVNNGKLAVIIGVEMDNIGNFYSPTEKKGGVYNPNPTNDDIKTELDRLWDLQVRYIFPIHVTNNIFGGTALYVPTFNVANKYNTGFEYIPEPINTKESNIGFDLEHPILHTNPEADFLAWVALDAVDGILPEIVNPSTKTNYTFWKINPGEGHRNSLGLTDKGRFGIKYMMQKGFLIDVDHMSEKCVNEVLDFAIKNDYPVNSGHNEFREEEGNENNRTINQYKLIKQTGGMIGLGHSEVANKFVERFRRAIEVMDYSNVAIGTDVNGLFPLPRPDTSIAVVYDNMVLKKCATGNRTWDINTDGFAHYGLFPDYIKSWEKAGMTMKEKDIFMSSAEYFTRMWEKCESKKTTIEAWPHE